MVHSEKVHSTASYDASSTSRCWPSSPIRATGTGAAARREADISQPRSDGSTASSEVTAAGRCGRFRPEPKPTSSTRPDRPPHTSARSRRTSPLDSARSTSRGTTLLSHQPTRAP